MPEADKERHALLYGPVTWISFLMGTPSPISARTVPAFVTVKLTVPLELNDARVEFEATPDELAAATDVQREA